MERSFEGNVGVMASLLANEHTHCTRARSALRHAKKQKKERNKSFSLSVPYDVLFSNEYLKDLARLWELHTIIPYTSLLGAEER